MYSTFLGGVGNDRGYGIAVDATGAAHVTGSTTSTDFPLNLAIQSTNAGGTDAFITKIAADGSSLAYSTYLGGSGDDTAYGIATDADGASYVTGSTASSDFPTAHPIISRLHGTYDAFVTKVASSAFPKQLNLIYSTYLGGSDNDFGSAIAVDAQGCAYVAGQTILIGLSHAQLPVSLPLRLRGLYHETQRRRLPVALFHVPGRQCK